MFLSNVAMTIFSFTRSMFRKDENRFSIELGEFQDDLTQIDDWYQLQYELKRQRIILSSLINAILKIESSYERTVARADYETLFYKENELQIEFNRLKSEYQSLSRTCVKLIGKTQDLINERDRYFQNWQCHRLILTPRPDWNKVSNVIDGRIPRWKLLSTGKSSEQLVNILLEEFIDGNQSIDERTEHFSGLGLENDILPFLRIEKKTFIFNRQMHRRSTITLIKDIW